MSKFHDEFFRQGSPVHDALMIKCLSEDGVWKIILASGVKSAAVWPESVPRTISGGLCEIEGNRVWWDNPEHKCSESCEYKDECKNTNIKKVDITGYIVPHVSIKKETEVIVRNGTFILGYADAVITYCFSYEICYSIDDPIWIIKELGPYYLPEQCIIVEAKPELTSLGEVIRQLKTYALLMKLETPPKMIIATYSKLGEDALEYLANENIIVVQFDRA